MATTAFPRSKSGRWSFLVIASIVAALAGLAIATIVAVMFLMGPGGAADSASSRLGPNDDYATRHLTVAPALGPNDDYALRHTTGR